MSGDRRFGLRGLLIWGAGIVAAVWLATTATGAVTQADWPGIALSVYPRNGFAFQSQAVAGVGEVPIQQIKMSDTDLANAREALRQEPFATTALTLVGFWHDQHRDHATAARMIAAAHRLDKRQLLANAWLIHEYGSAGRDREVLALLDEALKVKPELAQSYMPAFALALQNAETIPAFRGMLRGHPAWQKEFWDAAAAYPAALPNAAALRSQMLAEHEELGPVDKMLVDAFVASGRTDLAIGFARNLPADPEDRNGPVRNPSFTRQPLLPPLDWQFISDGRISAAVDEGSGTLQLNALPGAGGTVARQLLALSPGNYSLLVKLGQAALPRGSDLGAHVYCAERGNQMDIINVRLTADLERTFTTSAACRFFWLDLNFSAIDSSEPALGSVAEIRISQGNPLPTE